MVEKASAASLRGRCDSRGLEVLYSLSITHACVGASILMLGRRDDVVCGAGVLRQPLADLEARVALRKAHEGASLMPHSRR